jgi:hypothetical protein
LIPCGGVLKRIECLTFGLYWAYPLETTLNEATPGDFNPLPKAGTSSGVSGIFGGLVHESPEQGFSLYSIVPPEKSVLD